MLKNPEDIHSPSEFRAKSLFNLARDVSVLSDNHSSPAAWKNENREVYRTGFCCMEDNMDKSVGLKIDFYFDR